MEMRHRALVVEDEPVTRALVVQLIRNAGCDVDEATDGEEALVMLAARRYDVVLLDIVLPKVTGTEVMERLHRRDPEMLERVIVVTGLNVEEIRTLFPRVCHALGKPVMPNRVLASVQKCLAVRHHSVANEHFTAR